MFSVTVRVFFAFVAVAPFASRAAAADSFDPDRIVVLMSIDGLCGYYFDDPKAEMPTIRELAAKRAHAASMKASTPTVTWSNHTTLVTGVHPARHGVIANNYFDRATRKTVTLIWDPVYDKADLVKTPTICDVAKAAGMTTAAIRWPATRNAKEIDWNIPDVGGDEAIRQFTTPKLLEECNAAGITIDDNGGPGDPQRRDFKPKDEMWTKAFLKVLHDHRPQLALLHTVEVDHVQHVSGPRSPEAYDAIKEADRQVREVWEALEEEYPGKATLLVVSYHGFSPINRAILPNVVLRQAGLVEIENDKITGGPVALVGQGGAAMVYVLDDARRPEIVDKIKLAFADVEGVSKIVGVDEFPAYGLADPVVDARSPDLVLFAELGYNFGDTAAGELRVEDKPERKGSHGHDPNLAELHATFVAVGAGIRGGAELGEVENTCVAPTIARLLGLEMPGVDGAALEEALAGK